VPLDSTGARRQGADPGVPGKNTVKLDSRLDFLFAPASRGRRHARPWTAGRNARPPSDLDSLFSQRRWLWPARRTRSGNRAAHDVKAPKRTVPSELLHSTIAAGAIWPTAGPRPATSRSRGRDRQVVSLRCGKLESKAPLRRSRSRAPALPCGRRTGPHPGGLTRSPPGSELSSRTRPRDRPTAVPGSSWSASRATNPQASAASPKDGARGPHAAARP